MSPSAPPSTAADTALGNKAVDMGFLYEVTTKGMENTDKTGREALGFIVFLEHAEDDTADGGEETAKEEALSEEERPELFSNGKDTMAVGDVKDLKGYGSGAVNGVFRTADGTETAVASERDKFKFTAFITAIHATTESRDTAAKHPIGIPDDGVTGMKDINDFFVMVFENVLENIYGTIMKDLATKTIPHKTERRGSGADLRNLKYQRHFFIPKFRRWHKNHDL